MASVRVQGLRVRYEAVGSGAAVVLVHGSFDDLHAWDAVVPLLADTHRVIRYDRRGHGGSECPPGQGRIGEDADDLIALVHALGETGVHLVGHSYGATVALLAAARQPGIAGTLTVHEPPLFGLLAGTPDAELAAQAKTTLAQALALMSDGRMTDGTRLFVDEAAFGPGTWAGTLTAEQRRTFVAHAATWMDQARDPDRLALDGAVLAGVGCPVLITYGDNGLPWYPPTVCALHALLPDARLRLIPGSGHAPHLTHPGALAAAIDGPR